MKVLLSIKPEFVAKIESGEKMYEYRKTIFRRPEINTVVVYATSPICRIVGEFDIEGIESGTPVEIWQRTHTQGGVAKRFYDNYFKKSDVAYAIKIGAYRKYPLPIKIADAYPNMTAPQSFKYIKSNNMHHNIIFLGGIHGVGKTTYSEFLKKQIPSLIILSCSQVLQWKDPKEKEVDNVDENQNRLVTNLSKMISPSKQYLLDGHFCLRNTEGEIEPIGIETFRAIAPAMIILLEENASVIQERLQKRDGKIYPKDDLEAFFKIEKEQASLVAKVLNVPLFIVPSSNPERSLNDILSELKEHI